MTLNTRADRVKQIRLQYNESSHTLVCEVCGETINVGLGGLGNYRKVHKNSPRCIKTKEKKEKAENAPKKQKNGSLLRFLKKATAPRPPTQPAQSTSTLPPAPSNSDPPPVLQTSLFVEPTPSSVAAGPVHEESAGSSSTRTVPTSAEILCMKNRGGSLLSRLRLLVTHLPLSVPEATETDDLAQYAEPFRFDDPGIPSEDLDCIVKRGRLGVEGLLGFVEYFVRERGVPEGLFEGKLSRRVLECAERSTNKVVEVEPHNESQHVAPSSEIECPTAISVDDEPEVQVTGYQRPCTPSDSMQPSTSLGITLFPMANSSLRRTTASVKPNRSPIHARRVPPYQHGVRIPGISRAHSGAQGQGRSKPVPPLQCLEPGTDYRSQKRRSRIARVIHVGLQQNRGIAGILEKLSEAARGVYKVKSFRDDERMLAKLLWRLGGARVGHIMHRALGLPGVSTCGGGRKEHAEHARWNPSYHQGRPQYPPRRADVRRARC